MNRRDERFVLLGFVLFWTVSAMFHVTGSIYLARIHDRPLSSWGLLSDGAHWLYFIGFAPLCLWLARRFPVRRDHWRRPLAIVALIGIPASLALAAVQLVDFWWLAHVQQRAFDLAFAVRKHAIWAGYSNWLTFAMTAGLVYALHTLREAQRLEREAAAHSVRVAELERSLVGAQLRALQTQLQPHFIFNTHHAINSLILKGENTKAVRMLTQLSELLRLTLEQRTTPLVSLRDELELLQSYLEIQQTRFGDRLQVELEIPDDLLVAQVPSLILQPLVENGIKHGVEKHDAPGRLRVIAAREADRLTLAVENSGASARPNGATARDGIGLSTTRERLQQLFGADQHFHLHALPAGGMRAELTIPFRAGAAGTRADGGARRSAELLH